MTQVAEIKQRTYAVYKELTQKLNQTCSSELAHLWHTFDHLPQIDNSSSALSLSLNIDEAQTTLASIEQSLQSLATQPAQVMCCGKLMHQSQEDCLQYWSEK